MINLIDPERVGKERRPTVRQAGNGIRRSNMCAGRDRDTSGSY